MKILVVDDERLLVKGLKFNLENEGFQVTAAYDGLTAVELARNDNFDLILLDIMMPGLDGLGACMKIREFSTVPIILLTAKSEDMDKIIGLECGADDYITKPFNILELKARIRALIRRSAMNVQPQSAEMRIELGKIAINIDRRTAEREGKEVELTSKEFDLVELLMKNPGKVYSRESLLNIIWGNDYSGDIRTVDVHMHRIRDKLEKNPAEPEYIVTKWGVGYYFKA